MPFHLFRRVQDPRPVHSPDTDAALLEDAASAAARELVMSARLDDIPTALLLAPLEDVALDRTIRARYRAFRP